jgi:hypothetical protein
MSAIRAEAALASIPRGRHHQSHRHGAQSARFPNPVKLVHEQSWQRSNAAVAALLDRFAKTRRPQAQALRL